MRKASVKETGTKYKSKIDRIFYGKVLVTLVLGIVLLAIYFVFHNILLGFLGTWMFVALLVVFLPEYRSTYYIIRSNGLFVKNGLFDKATILYRQMLEVTEEKGEARNGSSKVALSKDRIYIRYRIKKKEYWLEISPENKEQFLQEIHEKRLAIPSRKAAVQEAPDQEPEGPQMEELPDEVEEAAETSVQENEAD